MLGLAAGLCLWVCWDFFYHYLTEYKENNAGMHGVLRRMVLFISAVLAYMYIYMNGCAIKVAQEFAAGLLFWNDWGETLNGGENNLCLGPSWGNVLDCWDSRSQHWHNCEIWEGLDLILAIWKYIHGYLEEDVNERVRDAMHVVHGMLSSLHPCVSCAHVDHRNEYRQTKYTAFVHHSQNLTSFSARQSC